MKYRWCINIHTIKSFGWFWQVTSLAVDAHRAAQPCGAVAPLWGEQPVLVPPTRRSTTLSSKSTCLTQLTLGPYVVQVWWRNPRMSEETKPLNSVEWPVIFLLHAGLPGTILVSAKTRSTSAHHAGGVEWNPRYTSTTVSLSAHHTITDESQRRSIVNSQPLTRKYNTNNDDNDDKCTARELFW